MFLYISSHIFIELLCFRLGVKSQYNWLIRDSLRIFAKKYSHMANLKCRVLFLWLFNGWECKKFNAKCDYSWKKDYILTPRELEHLSLVALGFTNPQIAKKLIVSRSSVKKTLENIFRKLGAHSRANAVARAFMHKLLSEELLSQISAKYHIEEQTNASLA